MLQLLNLDYKSHRVQLKYYVNETRKYEKIKTITKLLFILSNRNLKLFKSFKKKSYTEINYH